MNTEFLLIQSSWNSTGKYNVFSIRFGGGEKYENLYRYLNASGSARSVANDFPWDHVVFDDLQEPWDHVVFDDLQEEQQFMVLYKAEIENDREHPYRPGSVAVPPEDRIIGESYLDVCGHYHVYEGLNVEDTIFTIMAQEIAGELDAAIVKELSQNRT